MITSQIPRGVWWIICIPLAALILAMACLVCTYSSVIKNAKKTHLTYGDFSIKTEQQLQAMSQRLHLAYQINEKMSEDYKKLIDGSKKIPKPRLMKESYQAKVEKIAIEGEPSQKFITHLKNQFDLLEQQKNQLQQLNSDIQKLKDQLASK